MDGIIIRWERIHETKLFIEEHLDPDIEYFMQTELTPRMAETIIGLTKMRNELVKTMLLLK